MIERAKQLVVGLFILAGVAGFVFLSFAITTKEPMLDRSGYTLYANFDDVTGLLRLSPIRISGVLVGRVVNISLDKDNRAKLTLYIFDEQMKIPTDSTLAIQTEGLLGQRYLRINPGILSESFKKNQTVSKTRSALVLEDLISRAVGVVDEPEILNEGIVYTALFEKIDGLKIDDYIYERGVLVGKISDLKLEDDMVHAKMFFYDNAFKIGEKDKIYIRSSSLLGGRYVELKRSNRKNNPDIDPEARKISSTFGPNTIDSMLDLVQGMLSSKKTQ